MREKLQKEQNIPLQYVLDLEERLLLAFRPPLRRNKPGQERQKAQVYRSRWRLKKAQSVYSEVRERDPHIFLPFILSTPPKACESFDISKFDQEHQDRRRVYLNDDCRQLLEDRAKKVGIEGNSQFQDLIVRLFKPGS